jgi:glycosyltransferase involved in cell wall biosynthesis
MKIAVNTRFLIKNKLEGIGWFTYETFKRITTEHPEHQFYFFFDRDYDASFIFSDNVIPVKLFPPARHPLLWYWWFEFSVARALKKIQPDIFISPDGYLSLSTETKTLMVVHDLAFEHYPQYINKLTAKYYQYFTPKFVARANKIVTVSEASKRDIIDCYGTDVSKIVVAHNGASEKFKPLNETEIKETRIQYSGGKNYFVYAGSLHPRKNIANLFKAFDRFKKETQSDFKLVLAGARGWMLKDIDAAFRQMQFKEDVIFTGHLETEELSKIVASAFAMVYVSVFEGFGIPVLEAMKCEVPVITSDISSMPEVAGDAALLVNPFDIHSISEEMIQLYNDEILRKDLVEKGKIQSKKFSWDNTADVLWNTAMEILNYR